MGLERARSQRESMEGGEGGEGMLSLDSWLHPLENSQERRRERLKRGKTKERQLKNENMAFFSCQSMAPTIGAANRLEPSLILR